MKTAAPPLHVVPPEPSWLPLIMLLLALVVLMLVAAACDRREAPEGWLNPSQPPPRDIRPSFQYQVGPRNRTMT